MNYNIPKGTVDAARALLAEHTGLNVDQVDYIALRGIDANEENPHVLTLIPLGATLGVVIHKQDELYEDKDILFVSMAALGNCLPALGFTAIGPVSYIIPPKDAV